MRIYKELLNESFRLLGDDLDFKICRLFNYRKKEWLRWVLKMKPNYSWLCGTTVAKIEKNGMTE
jgi:hypothetical protein